MGMKKQIDRAKAMSFTLNENDIQKMIDSTDNIRDRIVIEFLAYTGCRRRELKPMRIL